jgi:hypothetical protein
MLLDREIGSLSPSHAPNVAGKELFWFGLRVVRILANFLLTSPSSRGKLYTFPHLLETGFEEKIAVCAHTPYNSPVEEVG